MNYAVIEYVNGSFIISSEHGEDLDAAKIAWCNLCAALIGEKQAVNATVKLVDANLEAVEGFIMDINHPEKE